MRCARCGRMLFRPGVEVAITGGKVVAGPKCAELLQFGELGRPRRTRVMPPLRRRSSVGQGDLFGMTGLSGIGST
jgi:hypothetical protein